MHLTVSVFLDLIRFLAAVTVLFGHLTQSSFSSGWTDLTEWGVAAVAVFFVLSGFVIRHVSTAKELTFESYSIARLARIYSVLIPAIFLTILADSLSHYLNESYYSYWAKSSTDPVLRVLANTFFISQAHGHDVALFSNKPAWSLGYEVPFYFVYGTAYFCKGKTRFWLLGLIFILLGPTIFVLLPVWLMGVWLYDLLKKVSPSVFFGIVSAVMSVYVASQAFYVNETVLLFVDEHPSSFSFIWAKRASSFPLFYVMGVATSLMITSLHALRECLHTTALFLKNLIRAAASATFSIYLYHFPLLILVYATTEYDKSNSLSKILVFIFVLSICICLSFFTESKKRNWANAIKGLFQICKNFFDTSQR